MKCLIIILILLSGCNPVDVKDKIDDIKTNATVETNTIGMHNKEIAKEAAKVSDKTKEDSTKESAGVILSHTKEINKSVDNLTGVIDNVDKLKTDIDKIEQDRDDAIADRDSAWGRYLPYITVICPILAGIGLTLFLMYQTKLGLSMALASTITLIYAYVMVKYITWIVGGIFAVVGLIVIVLVYYVWKNKLVSLEFFNTGNILKKYIPPEHKDEVKDILNNKIQSKDTRIAVMNYKDKLKKAKDKFESKLNEL